MLYLFIDSKQIKLLCLRKSLLGQQEVSFFEKKHEVELLNNGRVADTDLLASAIKEGLTALGPASGREKEVVLILSQGTFEFLRTEVPADVAPSAVVSFVKDKARSSMSIDLDGSYYDFFIKEYDNKKQIAFFALDREVFERFREVANLLELKLISLIPESLAYYKLFEKTLKPNKKEVIFYVNYEKTLLKGYLYDSFGLLPEKEWFLDLKEEVDLIKTLKEKVNLIQNEGIKINRIILSGSESEKVRQDTFTKAVGVWTNPLKRIIPNFYDEYLKLLVPQAQGQFPILNFDVCFGAFIFIQENKEFSILKRNNFARSPGGSMPKINLSGVFKKEILIFTISFLASFVFFVMITRLTPSLFKSLGKKTDTGSEITNVPTQPPTSTPTPSIKRDEIKIKLLNGSGTPGKASEVKEILNKEGYQEIITGNADSFDYKTTVFEIKKEKKEALVFLKEDLKDYLSKFDSKNLAEEETADVIIIIGKDFK